MNKIEVCPQQLLSFDADPQLTQDVLVQLNKEFNWQVSGNGANSYSKDTFLHKRDEFKQLIQWFDQCLNECKEYIGFNFDGKFSITQCWANRATANGYHSDHFHANSLVSAIFYLTEPSAHTCFKSQSIWHGNYTLPIQNVNAMNDPNHYTVPQTTIQPKAGRLLLFPSSLLHGVEQNTIGSVRYTMSFNTFIEGSIGNKMNLTYTPLKV